MGRFLSGLLVAEFGFMFGRSIQHHVCWMLTDEYKRSQLPVVRAVRAGSSLDAPLVPHSILPPSIPGSPVRSRVKALGGSADESARAAQLYNSLPAEVWRQIFATAVRPCIHAQRSRTIDDDDDDSFSLVNLERPYSFCDSRNTKLALCLVSKSFNSLATEFLYEHILLTSYKILNTAIRLSTHRGANRLWWTKALWLCFSFTRGIIPSVAPLLSKCVNLRLLIFEVNPRVDLDQVKTVYRSLPQSVRAIRWDMGGLPIFQHIPTTVLDNICQMSIESGTMVSIAITLPRLTSLRAKDIFAPTNLTLPALRNVCSVAWQRTRELESSPFGLFIQSYAQQITTLQIEISYSMVVDFPIPLIDCCTNLATLKYDPFMVCIRNPPQSINRAAVQHAKLTHVYLCNPYYCPDIIRVMSLNELWEASYT